jgi:hypothetical protein
MEKDRRREVQGKGSKRVRKSKIITKNTETERK